MGTTKLRIIGSLILLFNFYLIGSYNIQGFPVFLMTFCFALAYEIIVVKPKTKEFKLMTDFVKITIIVIVLFVLVVAIGTKPKPNLNKSDIDKSTSSLEEINEKLKIHPEQRVEENGEIYTIIGYEPMYPE